MNLSSLSLRHGLRSIQAGRSLSAGSVSSNKAASIGIVLAALFLAVFFGLAVAVLPWQFVVGGIGLPVLLIVGAALPTLLFVVALLLLFGIVPEFIMAALPLGGATLRPAELILIFCFLVVMARVYSASVPLRQLLKPFSIALALLGLGLALGFVKGKLMANNTLALADARQFVGWLALPIALWLGYTKPHMLQRIIIGIALLAGTLMVLQLGLGVQLIYGFRGAEVLSKDFSDVTRSAIGGGLFFLAYGAYRLFLHACDGLKWRWFALLGSLICIGGIVASFNRAVWAGFVLGALMLLLLKPPTRRSALAPFLAMLVCLLLALSALFAAKPRMAEALLERVTSVRDEGKRGSSLGFRFEENSQALEALRASPVLGLGFGGEYKRVYRQLSNAGSFDTELAFIHNGYLSLWLKLGVFGLIFPAALLISTWLTRLRQLRSELPTSVRLNSTSALSTVILLMISLLTSADLTTSSGTAALAAVLGLMLAGYRVEFSTFGPASAQPKTGR